MVGEISEDQSPEQSVADAVGSRSACDGPNVDIPSENSDLGRHRTGSANIASKGNGIVRGTRAKRQKSALHSGSAWSHIEKSIVLEAYAVIFIELKQLRKRNKALRRKY